MKIYVSILSFVLSLLAFNASAQSDTALATDSVATAQSVVDWGELSNDELWDAANTFYVNGEYQSAERTYKMILDRGVHSAKLYYNLANAYFKMDEIGSAILYYHRALRLDPGSDDIRYNLDVAQEHTKDRIEQVPEFFLTTWFRAVRNVLSSTVWGVLSLVCLALMALCVLLYLLGQRLSLRKMGFYGALVMLILCLSSSYFAAQGRLEIVERRDAVVMSKAVSVKSSPDRASTDLFVIHEGTLVEISDKMEGWREIVIADGKKGWVRSEQIEVI